MICALIARWKFKPELEFQASTSSYSQAGTSSHHELYKYENIVYVEVPEDNLCNTCKYMNSHVPFVTYVWRTWEHVHIIIIICCCCCCCCCCCFLHITTYLVRVLTDDDCCTDERTPPPCAPSAWLNNEINVIGGWCGCTHLFGVEANAGTQNKLKNRQCSS